MPRYSRRRVNNPSEILKSDFSMFDRRLVPTDRSAI